MEVFKFVCSYFKKIPTGAGKMAQQARALASKPELGPKDPIGGRKEQTPSGCLSPDLHLYATAQCTHT